MEQTVLQAKIKWSTIKTVFLQMKKKDIRPNRAFFMSANSHGLKMIFSHADHESKIYIELRRSMFSRYDLHSEHPTLYKFDIQDFDLLTNMFEHNTMQLALIFHSVYLQVVNEDYFSGSCSFHISTLSMQAQELPEQISSLNFCQPQEDIHTQILIPKASTLSNILSSMAMMKHENFLLRLKSNDGKIEIFPMPSHITESFRALDDQNLHYKMRVRFLEIQLLEDFIFPIRKLKGGLCFFDNNEPIQLTLNKNCMKIDSMEKDRKEILIVLPSMANLI